MIICCIGLIITFFVYHIVTRIMNDMIPMIIK